MYATVTLKVNNALLVPQEYIVNPSFNLTFPNILSVGIKNCYIH